MMTARLLLIAIAGITSSTIHPVQAQNRLLQTSYSASARSNVVYRLPMPYRNPGVRNGLPPVLTDSFVKNAGAYAEAIYGDEGTEGLPPYEEFTPIHRINVGINAINDQGLTTGHSSCLPTSWGGDEFEDTEPFTKSGSNNGTYAQWASTQGMPLSSDRPNPFHGYSNWCWDLNDFRTRDELEETKTQRLTPHPSNQQTANQ